MYFMTFLQRNVFLCYFSVFFYLSVEEVCFMFLFVEEVCFMFLSVEEACFTFLSLEETCYLAVKKACVLIISCKGNIFLVTFL
jgi:hypothetical protein